MYPEGDVVVHLGGLAVAVPAFPQIPVLQTVQIRLQLFPVPGPAHAPEGGLNQHPKEQPVVLRQSPPLHTGQPPVEVFRLSGGEAHCFPAEHQGQGDGGHLHDLLVVVCHRPPVSRVVRGGSVQQPLAEQGQPVRPASLAPQGGQPPQHPGESLHMGGGLSIVGGKVPQMQAGVPGGETPFHRLQELKQSPLHIRSSAQGILPYR